MARTPAEKKRARAIASGRSRKAQKDDLFAAQAAELANAQARIAELSSTLSALQLDLARKANRIAELEAVLARPPPQPAQMEQCWS